jgi:hypothetical protein
MARNFKEAPLVSTKNSTNSQELGRKLKKIITQVKQNFSDQFKRANIFWDEKVFEIITIFFSCCKFEKIGSQSISDTAQYSGKLCCEFSSTIYFIIRRNYLSLF